MMAKKKKRRPPRMKDVKGVTWVEDEPVTVLEHWIQGVRKRGGYPDGFEGFIGGTTFESRNWASDPFDDHVAVHDVAGPKGGGWWCDPKDADGRQVIVQRFRPVTDAEVREVFGLADDPGHEPQEP